MRELARWLLPTLVLAAVSALLLTRTLIRRLPARLLDHPNGRSLHGAPRKRGGGLAIVVVVLAGIVLHGLVTGRLAAAAPLLAGMVLVAGVSLLDDLRSLPAGVRLAVHALAAGIALWAYAGGGTLDAAMLALAFLWVVGLTNAYNFMDGIDGLAAVQALIAGLAWALIGVAFGSAEVALVGGLAGAGALGFYRYNRAPARIFMGDVGSAFLGYTFAVLPLLLGAHPNVGIAAVLIMGGFVFDTAFTFVRRLVRGEPVLRPHRSHLYQRLVIAGRSHAGVTRLYAATGTLLAGAGIAALFGGGRWSLGALLLLLATGTSLWLYTRAHERRGLQQLEQT